MTDIYTQMVFEARRLFGRLAAGSWCNRIALVVISILALLALTWCVSSLWLPYGWDHGVFGAVSDVIRRGGVPYRDIWEMKGPVALYLYAAVQGVGHPQMWGVRVLDLIFLAGAAYAGFNLVSSHVGRGAAAFGVATTVLGFAGFGNWYTAQPDDWAAQLLVVLVWLLVAPGRSGLRLAIAAGLLGLLCMLKPTYGLVSVLFVPVLLRNEQGAWRVDLPNAVLVLAATALPIVLILGYLGMHGALGALFDQHIAFNFEHVASDAHLQMPLWRIVQLTASIVTGTPELAAALPVAMLGAIVAWRRDDGLLGKLLALWLPVALLTVAIQHKFLLHNYSWHPAYPPMLLGASIGIGWLWKEAQSRVELKTVALGSALLISYFVAKEPATQTAAWLRWCVSGQSLANYHASFESRLPWLANQTPMEAFGFSVSRDVRFAEYVRAQTPVGSEVLVWTDPLINYLSDRPSPTPITTPEAFTIWGTEARRARYRSELARAIKDRRAALIGVPSFALQPTGDPEFNLNTGFPEFVQALGEAYERAGEFENLQLFRPRQDR